MLTAIPRDANPSVLHERARIARELHHSVSQTLYAITLTISRALHLVDQGDASQLQQSLSDVLRLADRERLRDSEAATNPFL